MRKGGAAVSADTSKSRTAGANGMTPREVARLLRISPDRVRAMIVRGELGAINTATVRCAKPRYVILPHHLAAFEQGRAAGPPPKSTRRRKKINMVDYYPD
jgi:hypothetical protein